MGQKVHPKGFRLGVIKTWGSRWYADKSFAKFLHEDMKIKKYVKKMLEHAGVADVQIERAASKVRVNIGAARPGIIIGKKGTEITKLKNHIQKMTEKEIFNALHLKEDHFIILASEKYRKHLIPQFTSYEIPLKGLTQGRQMQRLKELLANE